MGVKVTEDWRRARDNNETVGIVFIGFKKAFDSIRYSVLLQNLQGIGIIGDIWSCIKDYLVNRNQVTTVNGCSPRCSKLLSVFHKVLCSVPPYFLSFVTIYRTLLGKDDLHMYTDDTTISVTDPNPDMVAISLNFILSKLDDWCRHNNNFLLTEREGRTGEYWPEVVAERT